MAVAEPIGTVREIWPLLFVRDIDHSIAFYRDRLGFTLAGEARSDDRVFWCRVKRGGATIMLQQAEAEDGPAEGRGRGVSFYFICDDADAMYAELSARGLKPDPPVVAYYGMKQLFVAEPDGYSICFESPIEEATASEDSVESLLVWIRQRPCDYAALAGELDSTLWHLHMVWAKLAARESAYRAALKGAGLIDGRSLLDDAERVAEVDVDDRITQKIVAFWEDVDNRLQIRIRCDQW